VRQYKKTDRGFDPTETDNARGRMPMRRGLGRPRRPAGAARREKCPVAARKSFENAPPSGILSPFGPARLAARNGKPA